MTEPSDRWQKLLAALKAARGSASDSGDAAGSLQPPPGFATRIAARAAAERRDRSLALWRRWSLRFAVGSTCLFLVAALYAVVTKDTGSLLPLPALDLPSPTP